MGGAARALSGAAPATAWVLTDGKAGDEAQCLGVADAMGLEPETRRVRPRALLAWAMPWGPIDPAEAPDRPGSPIAPPFPEILIASGRRSIPYVGHVKRASGGRTFTFVVKDPRTGSGAADLIWVAEHDRLRGPNVLVSLTAPHRMSAARLAAARAEPDGRVGRLGRPRVAVLAGGDSRHHRFTPGDVARFAGQLRALAETGARLAITTSRRTPASLREALIRLAAGGRHFLWDGSGPNPYPSLLAATDAIVVTADSTNMVGEAAATGTPVLVFEPSGGHGKITALLEGLARHGAVRRFAGQLEAFGYQPLDSTPEIARAVAAGLDRHREAVGLGRRSSPWLTRTPS